SERRKAPRVELMALVRVKRGKVDLVMELSNISLTGALVDMGSLRPPSWIKERRVVDIGIVHPDDLHVIESRGRSVRIEKAANTTRFAVEFVEVGGSVRRDLERLMARPRSSAPPRRMPPPLPR